MRDEALDASNESAAESEAAETPGGEPAWVSRPLDGRPDQLRERIMEAMLITSGEIGYRDATVAGMLERYGGNEAQFFELFAGKADCYRAAYEFESERLRGNILAAAATAENWREGLRASLAELARFARERPLGAKGLLVEVHVAGGRALAKREAVMERLSRAIDSARRENESRHSPPPITANFMVSAIDACVVGMLARGEPQNFSAAIPELAHMVVSAYFGEEAGREELELGPPN
jgi:AcrR family transcriptional regulator